MINKWLDNFKTAWLTKDIDAVLNLFDEGVEYWETPNKKVDVTKLKNEWLGIHLQDNISLDLSVYSSQDKRFTVKWRLSYTDQQATQQNWSGIYLVELNNDNKCTYFYQTGEQVDQP